MKNWSFAFAACALLVLPFCFSACVKDACNNTRTYTYFEPVFKTKAEARANIKSNRSRDIEKTGKIYILGNTIFLNEVDKGVHVIDNRNPASPRKIAFIDIPGNRDIAVKGNILYADMYTDLIALDISNPLDVKVTKIVENLFPNIYYAAITAAGPDKILTDWIEKKVTVTVDCDEQSRPYDLLANVSGPAFFSSSSASALASSSPIGVGGSMARFTIMNDRLYTVSSSDLGVYDITNAADPVQGKRFNVGWNIETIFPFQDKLFIGSQTGMFIYTVTDPNAPTKTGQFNHGRSCDPVIADNDYAYVTLRSGNVCMGFLNELDVIKLNNLASPALVAKYNMTNPHGLSKDGNLLFICDGVGGLKMYNASNVLDLKLIKTVSNIDAYDVIAHNKIALVVGQDGLYQYDYSQQANIRLLSKISVKRD